ncbi:serine/threonine protein kinase [Amycolatopsis thermophila]|uniref:non-specific serine/threonine protein kinase n=1 Tax=Amycolatopsis thermophila TaxID=206084 RepID=A0ABU0F435_9PSEU|nr:serine/threonine protein kinase [Amycolatopsis thermophila]MDQ0381921.1 serine/threonine-protein kinase PknG [Amycolatopsis thermophila]
MGFEEEPPEPGSALGPGELVAGQYEVLTCFARGAFGFVHLARDRNLDGKQVVLKGLTRPHDTAAIKLAEHESRVLTALEHPNIVRIFNVVSHRGQRYLVMDHVDGPSLRTVRESGGLSIADALAAAVQILGALDYLHRQGLLYCDMKPDNVIRTGDTVKLIDFGAIRRTGDRDSVVLGTPPYLVGRTEIREHGLTERADIHAVGVMLDELVECGAGDPGAESFRRLVARARTDYDRRFADVPEMLRQVRGVLREVRCLADGRPRPARSEVFAESAALLDDGLSLAPPLTAWTTGGTATLGDGRPAPAAVATGLPVPHPDPADPQTPLLRTVRAPDPARLLTKLAVLPASVEVDFHRARAHLEAGNESAAAHCLAAAERNLGWRAHHDWRTSWHRGLLALAEDRVSEAADLFDDVYRSTPGEPAPKLALGFCAEHLARPDTAARFYESVWVCDRLYVSAAFGLARVRLRAGERAAAVAILDEVPEISLHRHGAEVAAVRILAGHLPGGPRPSAEDIATAADRLRTLTLDGEETWQRLATTVQESAFRYVLEHGDGALPPGPVLGDPVSEKGLRDRLEASYRALSRQARTANEHAVLIDRANAVRARSLW